MDVGAFSLGAGLRPVVDGMVISSFGTWLTSLVSRSPRMRLACTPGRSNHTLRAWVPVSDLRRSRFGMADYIAGRATGIATRSGCG